MRGSYAFIRFCSCYPPYRNARGATRALFPYVRRICICKFIHNNLHLLLQGKKNDSLVSFCRDKPFSPGLPLYLSVSIAPTALFFPGALCPSCCPEYIALMNSTRKNDKIATVCDGIEFFTAASVLPCVPFRLWCSSGRVLLIDLTLPSKKKRLCCHTRRWCTISLGCLTSPRCNTLHPRCIRIADQNRDILVQGYPVIGSLDHMYYHIRDSEENLDLQG